MSHQINSRATEVVTLSIMAQRRQLTAR